jgi:hypothetical protein
MRSYVASRVVPIIVPIGAIIIVCVVFIVHFASQSKSTGLHVETNPRLSAQKSDSRFLILRGDKLGYIDNQGAVVIKPQFDDAYPFREGFAAVMVNKKWGYIDKFGNFAISPQFRANRHFSEGLAGVSIYEDNVWSSY